MDREQREVLLRVELKKRELKARRRQSSPGSLLLANLKREVFGGKMPLTEVGPDRESLFLNA
jgi:hypothetical protein